MIESLAQWIKTEGIPAVLGLVAVCFANSTAQLVMANAASSVTALSPSVEPVPVSLASPHQSLSQGEK